MWFPFLTSHLFRGTEDVSWKREDILEELVQHQEPESLQSYLEKVKFKTITAHVCPQDTDTDHSSSLSAHGTLPVTSRIFSKLSLNVLFGHSFVYSYTGQ